MFVVTGLVVWPNKGFAESQGPSSPTTIVDDPSGPGTAAWASPGQAAASDDSYAIADLCEGETSHYLVSTGYGFSVPSNATVTGIRVQVERSALETTAGPALPYDSEVKIVKAGAIGSTNLGATSLLWQYDVDETVTYGGQGTLWGETWTPSDINGAGFGVAIASYNNFDGDCPDVRTRVDAVRVTVYYASGNTDAGDGGIPPWLRLVRQKNATTAKVAAPGTLRVHTFLDANGNGARDDQERSPVRDVALLFGGKSPTGSAIHREATVGDDGRATLLVPESTMSGYTVSVHHGSEFRISSPRPSVYVPPGAEVTSTIGLRYSNAIWSGSCLTFASDYAHLRSGALTLLSSLKRDSGSILPADRSSPLVSRRAFFLMASKLLCLGGENRLSSDENERRDEDVRGLMLVWSAERLPFKRHTKNGDVLDFDSPIHPKEAADFLGAFLRRRHLDVPKGVTHPYGGAGLTWAEAANVLVLSAFQAGTIPYDGVQSVPVDAMRLRAMIRDDGVITTAKRCLASDRSRRTTVAYTDVVPGDALFPTLRSLLGVGMPSSSGKTLWLLAGTESVSEFGILIGTPRFSPDQPMKIPETIRTLLVLACDAPYSVAETRRSDSREAGVGDSRAVTDRLTGVRRNSTLVSRIQFRAQDRHSTYNVSLLAFAEHVLRSGPKRPSEAFSLSEGADVFASALLFAAVREGRISRTNAETMTNRLSDAILTWLLSQQEVRHASDPLLRSDVVRFLGEVLDAGDDASHDALGPLWLERITLHNQ